MPLRRPLRLAPVVLLPLALLACGTPQEQCIARNTRDLRVVDRLIVETEGNLKRGYALERVTEYEDRPGRCAVPPTAENPNPPPEMCWVEVPVTVERPKAIDLRAEAAKLDSLRAKQRELSRAADSVIAQCRALHPE